MPNPTADFIGMAPLQKQAQPTPQPTPDPINAAMQSVQSKYPIFKNIPMAVTRASGPYESETYMPWDEENPQKGKLHVQLRSQGVQAQTGQQLHDTIASEGLHYLGAKQPDGQPVNPQWYALKQQFQQALTPRDVELAKQRWQEEQKNGEKRPFQQFMDQSYLDMFFRGYLFPQNQGPEWVARQGKWPPQQAQIMEKARALMQGQNAPSQNR